MWTEKGATGFKAPLLPEKNCFWFLPENIFYVEHIQLSNWDDPITDIWVTSRFEKKKK